MEQATQYRRHRQVQVQRILDTAQRLFITRGLEDVTLTQIAQACGITRATLYRYFNSKERILWEIHHLRMRQYGENLRALLGGRRLTTLERLTAFCNFLYAEFERDLICAGLADCSVFVDCGNGLGAFKFQISGIHRSIVVRHRSIFLPAADGQQRKKLFAHRASRLGKRYGQIWIGLVDGAADRKRFLARLELVLRCGLADQRDLYSDGMITRVRRIEGLLGGKVRSFREFKRICAVRELRCAERNHAAVRRTVIDWGSWAR